MPSVLKTRWTVLAVAALLVYILAGFFLVPRIIRNQIRDQARTQLNRDARVAAHEARHADRIAP